MIYTTQFHNLLSTHIVRVQALFLMPLGMSGEGIAFSVSAIPFSHKKHRISVMLKKTDKRLALLLELEQHAQTHWAGSSKTIPNANQ